MDPKRFALHLHTYRGLLPDAVLAYAEELGTTDAKRKEIAAYLETQAQTYAEYRALKSNAEINMALVKKATK